MRRRVWLTYVVRVDDAEDDDAAREIAMEQVRATYASPDGVEIERPDETKHETPPEPRRSYRQGDALRDALAALAARTATRPSVTISRDAAGNYSYDVRVTDEDPQAAFNVAIDLEQALATAYPPADQPDTLKVALTRNAKGETQIEVEEKGTDADIHVQSTYESLTARYPSASGKVTNDLPPEKGAK